LPERAESEWKRKLRQFSSIQQQRLEQKLEDYLAEFIQQQLAGLSILSNEDLEILIRDIGMMSRKPSINTPLNLNH
jgi:hypothetical protein